MSNTAGSRAVAAGTAADVAAGNLRKSDGRVVDGHLQLGDATLPPGGVAVEQTQAHLGLPVVGHLVLVLAALLSKGANAVVDPLVAVDLLLLTADSHAGAAAGQDDGTAGGGGIGNDGVDVAL